MCYDCHGVRFCLKNGKYFKKYLSPELYEKYAATYSGSNYTDIWAAIDTMCELFHTLAVAVAEHFGFTYRQDEENGINIFLVKLTSVSYNKTNIC